MKLFICEFITGGGMQNVDLPESLAREGDMMLCALLADLHDAGFDDIFCTRDARLDKPGINIEIVIPGNDVWQTWQQCIQESNAVWIIAPETGEVLYELSTMVINQGCFLVGCTPEAVKICSSKRETLKLLGNKGVPCVPVLEDINAVTECDNGWVIKPDDGVGCEDSYLFNELEALKTYIRHPDRKNFIVQEYIKGIPASISMLCHGGSAKLLSCNEQLFNFENGKGQLQGIIINGLRQYVDEFNEIARRVTAAIEGLQGYVGIDLIISDNGPLVLEINPRLTTAYAGLRQSLGVNPAAVILETLQSGRLADMVGVDYHPVTIRF